MTRLTDPGAAPATRPASSGRPEPDEPGAPDRPGPRGPYRVRLSSRGLPRALAVVVAVLIAVHLGLQGLRHAGVEAPWDLHLVFNVDDEPTVPTWFSSMVLLLASALLFLIAREHRLRGARGARHWLGLAAGFAFLSLDEIAALHEMMNTFVDVEWTVPGAIVAIVIGVVYAPFLWRLPPWLRTRLAIAAALYLGGALVVEHLSGPQFFPYDLDSMPYAAISALEEALEMSGVVVLVGALLRFMEERASGVPAIEIEPGGPPP